MNKGTVAVILSLDASRGWVVNAMPWLIYPQRRALMHIVQEAGWVPVLGWTSVENRKSSAPTRVQILNQPAHSKLLYERS